MDTTQKMDLAVKKFKKDLQKRVHGLKEVNSIVSCQFILFFFPISSRVGTDIDAAMKYLDQKTGNNISAASKQVIVVVLHPTHDADKTISNSNDVMRRENTFAVDCLFFEGEGLLECQRNKEAINKTAMNVQYKGLTSFYCMKKWDTENSPLIPEEGSTTADLIFAFFAKNKLAIMCIVAVVFIIVIVIVMAIEFK